jgi:pimeloyl-ACP methyl ester carboxylesterase
VPRLAANGLELAYEVAGSGDPLLFVSGTSLDRTVWAQQVAHFSAGFRCITLDNRAVGVSARARSPYTPRDMAADVAALLDTLAVPAAHVVGHSLGGAVAQELALARPDRVRSLVLIGCWARNDEYTRALFRTWKRMRAALDDRAFIEAVLLTGVGRSFLDAVGAETLAEMLLSLPNPQAPDAFCRQVDADLVHDTLDRLDAIAVPTLVVAGDEDLIFAPPHHRQLAAGIPGARLVTLAAIGHSPPIENSPLLNQTLEPFLRAA